MDDFLLRFCLLFCSLSSSLKMTKAQTPFPAGMEITFIQEDLKPGGESLILGTHIIGEAGVSHWTPLAGSVSEAGFANGDAQATRFNNPKSFLQLDETRIIIADTGNYCLRLLTRASAITTTTFSGNCGTRDGTDGDSQTARFYYPWYLAVDIKSPDYLIVLDFDDGGDMTYFRKVDKNTGETTAYPSMYPSRPFRYFTQHRLTFDLYGTTTTTSAINLLSYDKLNAAATSQLLPDIVVGDSQAGFQDGDNNIALFSDPKQLSFIDDDTLLIADEGNNRLRMYEISTQTSSSICDGGSSGFPDAGLGDCNINKPVSFYMQHCGDGDLYVVTHSELYVIKGK